MSGERRELDADPLTGITHNFVYEAGETPSQDKFVIETTQDVTDIIKRNRASLNEVDVHAAWGEWSKVASLPLSVYYDLKQQGILDDRARFKKWLNDPDNKAFRVWQGRL